MSFILERKLSFNLVVAFLGVFCCGISFVFAGPTLQKHPFTVADSIAMTRLIDPVVSTASGIFIPDFKFSPDGKYFVIVTRKGNLESGMNDYEIRLYKTADIRDYITTDTQEKLPLARSLIRLSSADSVMGLTLEGIREVRWLDDNRTLAFIGHSGNQPGQVYTLDIHSNKLDQLTHHPSTVFNYDFNLISGNIVYSARIDQPDKAAEQTSFVVGNKSINDVMNLGREGIAPFHFQFYQTQKDQQNPPLVLGDNITFPFLTEPVSLSPDGRWAVTGRRVTDRAKLSRWKAQYVPFTTIPHIRNNLDGANEDIEKPSILIKQTVLVNLKDRTIKPFFDAPDGDGMGGFIVHHHWLPDGENIILVNSFLPIVPGLDAREKKRRQTTPAILEYNVRTGAYHRIADLQVLGPDYRADEIIADSSLSPEGLLTLSWKMPENKVIRRAYHKEDDQWTETDPAPSSADSADVDFVLSVREDRNRPPEIWARDHHSGQQRKITDLNPSFRGLTFGRHEVLKWQDKEKRQWQAGLIYPPDYAEGRRYPLVIQTHGYNPREFLIDGPGGSTSVFAAQALANKGMLVVQLGEQRQGFGTRQELLNEQAGIESVIDLLDKRRILNRAQVGLAGWSSTGVTLLHTITFSSYNFAAATVADSFGLGLFDYILRFGGNAGGSFGQAEGKMGGTPWGANAATWVSRDPAFHSDRVTTPLRLEQYVDYKWVSGFWDIYALLKRQRKPVEFLMFPRGTHNLVKPRERYASQQGNVDWFAFWLKGEEDPDPAKAEQYKRWRDLRKQHEMDMKRKQEERN